MQRTEDLGLSASTSSPQPLVTDSVQNKVFLFFSTLVGPLLALLVFSSSSFDALTVVSSIILILFLLPSIDDRSSSSSVPQRSSHREKERSIDRLLKKLFWMVQYVGIPTLLAAAVSFSLPDLGLVQVLLNTMIFGFVLAVGPPFSSLYSFKSRIPTEQRIIIQNLLFSRQSHSSIIFFHTSIHTLSDASPIGFVKTWKSTFVRLSFSLSSRAMYLPRKSLQYPSSVSSLSFLENNLIRIVAIIIFSMVTFLINIPVVSFFIPHTEPEVIPRSAALLNDEEGSSVGVDLLYERSPQTNGFCISCRLLKLCSLTASAMLAIDLFHIPVSNFFLSITGCFLLIKQLCLLTAIVAFLCSCQRISGYLSSIAGYWKESVDDSSGLPPKMRLRFKRKIAASFFVSSVISIGLLLLLSFCFSMVLIIRPQAGSL